MDAGTTFRNRWAMGPEARALLLVTAVLTAFGLATLFSASALVALQRDFPATTYFVQQLSGVAVGIVAFAVAAKVDLVVADVIDLERSVGHQLVLEAEAVLVAHRVQIILIE